MKLLLVVVAAIGLASTGCAQNGILGGSKCRDGSCHVTRSQRAPRPEIVRTACRTGGCLTDRCASGCDCGAECSDCGPGGCALGGCRGNGCFGNGNGNGNGCGPGSCGRCRGCLSGGCCLCPHSGGYPEAQNFTPSPPTGQVAYPYYTTRGPRDFLQSNPPSIGPN